MGIAKDILLSPQQMQAVDHAAAEGGLSTKGLMERAGAYVAASALRNYPSVLRITILCGPGNNGGDGYVAARYLSQAGAEVAVYSYGDCAQLSGDARWAFEAWSGTTKDLCDFQPQSGDLIIDALFGAGLSRALDANLGGLFKRIASLRLPVIAVDLPSGVDGRTGALLGPILRADCSITFAALKNGHLLQPGASYCGEIELADIGIPERVLRSVRCDAKVNDPSLWCDEMPRLGAQSHKYQRGHLTVFAGGALMSGAARLSAEAALNAGAGIITLAAQDQASSTILANHLTSIMQVVLNTGSALEHWLGDKRHETFVIGPGFGDHTRLLEYLALMLSKRLVLDADALSAIAKNPFYWFEQFAHGGLRIMTPHEGEFARLFPKLAADQRLSKFDKAKAAASQSHSVIIYKGADTVIAAPDGRVVVNANAPPSLATAGSGDVLAGLCGAHLAQGTPAFEAACASVWLHGEAARRGQRNLNAEQLAKLVQPYFAE